VFGVCLFFSSMPGLSAAEQENNDAPATAGTPEVEQRMEQLPATAGTPEVEQRMEQLPATAGTPEVEQRMEQLPNDTPVDEISAIGAGVGKNHEENATGEAPNTSPRIKAHERFLFLHDQERYQEASAAALEVVQLTREEFGADHIKMVTPLVNLAITQAKNRDLPAAEANFKESIAIIEKREGVLSPRLINPLSGLGSAYNRAGLYEQGIVALERALLINHVNEGLYNFEQFKIQDGLTDSYSGMNALDDATFYQTAQVEISQRKLGVDHPGVANALYKLARWHELTNNTQEAMLAYRRADRILRNAGGDNNTARVEALQGIAHIFERQAQPSSTASTLKKALAIIDSQPEPDLLERAKILVSLGDLYTRQGKFESSESNYAEAWRDLSRDNKYLDQRDEYFAQPVRVSGGTFSRIEFNSRGKPDSSLKDGFVLISYTVTEKGRAKQIKVIESEPPGLMDGSIISTYKRSSYRPRRVEGDAVPSTNRSSRHDFKYFKALDESNEDSTVTSSTESSRDGERLEYPDPGE
jgi:tetratricopeptide (TPR) repeat protein